MSLPERSGETPAASPAIPLAPRAAALLARSFTGADPGFPPRATGRRMMDERAARLALLRAGSPAPEEAVRLARPDVAPAATASANSAPAPAFLAGEGGEPSGPGEDPWLGRLRGMGPGLAWALRRAGIADRATLARLSPEDLVRRLGPLGRLIPARDWIASARDTRRGGA